MPKIFITQHMYQAKTILLSVLTGLLSLHTTLLHAQMAQTLGDFGCQIDSTKAKELAIEIDNISFLKDNEYAGAVMKGYTLPGFWMQIKATYQPLKYLKLEAGTHGLVYSGAYKYPSYAYHDIEKWKGNQYQKGTHILPYFRAHLQLKSWQLVFGDIYGGVHHNYIAPLYNPEQHLTADPEFGFQAIYDSKRFHMDTWVNWQSFIFEEDSHQEAFCVGLSSVYRFNDENAPMHMYMPFQVSVQHRGGEQDTITTNSVQTLCNGALGFGVKWNLNRRIVQQVNVEADALMHWQQAGELWSKDTGVGAYAKAAVKFTNGIHTEGGYFYGNDFNSLLGIPYYGSVSLKEKGLFFKQPKTLFLSVDWSKKFAKHYAFGVKADVYYFSPSSAYNAEGLQPVSNNTSFSFGVFFRANPRFLIKKFN